MTIEYVNIHNNILNKMDVSEVKDILNRVTSQHKTYHIPAPTTADIMYVAEVERRERERELKKERERSRSRERNRDQAIIDQAVNAALATIATTTTTTTTTTTATTTTTTTPSVPTTISLPTDNVADVSDDELKKIIEQVAALPKPVVRSHVVHHPTSAMPSVDSQYAMYDYSDADLAVKTHRDWLYNDDSSEDEYGDVIETMYSPSRQSSTITDAMRELKIIHHDIAKMHIDICRNGSVQSRMSKDLCESRKQIDALTREIQTLNKTVGALTDIVALLSVEREKHSK